jgi:hypothetical protein
MADDPAFHARARELLDTLARGWSKGRVDMMIDLFHPDAILLETPFSRPLQGTEALRAWFADIPYHQSETTFSTGELFVAGPWFSSEFKLVFRRRKTGEWVDARGALFAETDGNLITELRMYWHRFNGGRETAPP